MTALAWCLAYLVVAGAALTFWYAMHHSERLVRGMSWLFGNPEEER